MEAKLRIKSADYHAWLEAVCARPGGDILAIQTLRNAIMSASVLASAALVAQMAVMASSTHMHKWVALALVLMLSLSASLAVWAIVRFAGFGFSSQLKFVDSSILARHLNCTVRLVKASAVLLMLSLGLAAFSVGL